MRETVQFIAMQINRIEIYNCLHSHILSKSGTFLLSLTSFMYLSLSPFNSFFTISRIPSQLRFSDLNGTIMGLLSKISQCCLLTLNYTAWHTLFHNLLIHGNAGKQAILFLPGDGLTSITKEYGELHKRQKGRHYRQYQFLLALEQ